MGANSSTPSSTPPTEAGAAAHCPVDHRTREIWLQEHKSTGDSPHTSPDFPNPNSQTRLSRRLLSTDREISSIPRAFDPTLAKPASKLTEPPAPSPYSSTAASHEIPSNAESETGHDKSTGNWIYPSERQFFEALMRKGNVASSTASASELATTVASIIPIHNAVNERAWQKILEWEKRAPLSDPGSKKCGGPKLYSFRGLGVEPQFLSPRAWWNGLMGYQLPFDRHDWVVERCDGERVEYVIDFYQGKSTGGTPSSSGLSANAGTGKLSFYLDVRPKLNSLEGCRMRLGRFLDL